MKEYNAHFYELSNKDSSNLFQAIEEIARILLKHIPDRPTEEIKSIKPKSKEKVKEMEKTKIQCCQIS